jgi:MoxR-like ATPase
MDQPEVSESIVFAAREEVLTLHMSDAVEEYIVQLIMATRQPEAYSSELASWIEYGASPRATIGLDRCARAHAWLLGKDFVSPDDVKAMAHDVLRHRLVVSYDGEISGVTADAVIDKLLELVPIA